MGSEEVSSLNWGTTSPKAQSKSGHSFPNDLLLSHNNTLGSSSAHSSSLEALPGLIFLCSFMVPDSKAQWRTKN